VTGAGSNGVHALLTIGKYILKKFTVRQLSGRLESLMADEMEWIRNRMQTADCASGEVSEKAVRLPVSRGSMAEHKQRALSLITDAAHVISDIEEGATALQARCEALLVNAIEKLKATEERINFLENERNTVTTRIRETELKVEEMQSALDEADAQMKAAGKRLWQAEQHARASAARAKEAEKAFVQIEEAIRSQLIGERVAPGKRVAAA
jgi:chromosome segregation ATPase